MPPGVGWLLGRIVRKQSLRRVVEQGFGRHSEADRLALVAQELAALSALLGDRPFLFGAAPHAVDASAFGVLDQLAARELNPGPADLVERHANLVRACRQPSAATGACSAHAVLQQALGYREGGAAKENQQYRIKSTPSCALRSWLQVAYRERIRARFFGPNYEAEVKWINDGPASGAASRVAGKQTAGGSKLAGLEDAARAKEE